MINYPDLPTHYKNRVNEMLENKGYDTSYFIDKDKAKSYILQGFTIVDIFEEIEWDIEKDKDKERCLNI